MSFEKRAWNIVWFMAVVLIAVSLKGAYWLLWKGLSLQPVVLDPVSAVRVYADLREEDDEVLEKEEILQEQVYDLSVLPQPVIQRTLLQLARIKRGNIYDRDSKILAEDIGLAGNYTRVYHNQSLAHVIGYSSALRTGVNGLELTYNTALLGLNRPDTEIDRLLHRPFQGNDLYLTLNSDIQKTSSEALKGRPGAVIVLDGKTGAVLSMTSEPSFDANRITEEGYLTSLSEGALLNRATQALYTPGSTWKTVTMLAALDTGQVTPTTVFDFGEPRYRDDGEIYYVYEVDGGIIPDSTHKDRILNLTMSYVYSANAAFARIGDEMVPDILIDYAARLGFSNPNYEKRFPLEITVSESQLANDIESIRTNNLLRASSAFGQGELLSTPINMAMVVESIVNDGSIPVPYFVEEIRTPSGKVIVKKPNSHLVRNIMKPETARQVKKIMMAVTENVGGQAYIGFPDVKMGMKTGTAQLGGNLAPHGWLIGFAEKGDKCVVIVVVLENGGGSSVTIPLFQQVAQAAIANFLIED